MERYERYKDSGVEWLGKVPEHWETLTIGAVTQLKSDKNHPEYNVLSVYREYGVIPKDSRNDNHNVTSEKTDTYKAVNPTDLIVNKMKAWQGSMGISKYTGIVSPAYITCSVNKHKINCDFLHYLLRSEVYIGEYNRLSYGVRIGQWDMHYEDFKHIPIYNPSLGEQERIVAFLDERCEKIDKAVEQKVRMIELLNERRQIIIQRAVTRGLNPDTPLRDSGIDWIGKIPTHWQVKRLKNIIKIKGRIGFRGYTTADLVDEGEGVITLSPSNMIDSTMNYEKCSYLSWYKYYESPEIMINCGDILFVKTGSTYGKTALVGTLPIEATINPQITVFKEIKCSAKFLISYMQTRCFKSQVETSVIGGTIPTISQEKIGNYNIVIPPLNEQQAIADYLDIVNEKTEKAIALKKQEIERLKEYRQTLINSAVTGKIKI